MNLDDLVKFNGVSRTELEARISMLVAALRAAQVGLAAAHEHAREALLAEGCPACQGARDYKAMLANLTATQERCTTLFNENRAMRKAAVVLAPPNQWEAAVAQALAELEAA